jgi:hypothetical protein
VFRVRFKVKIKTRAKTSLWLGVPIGGQVSLSVPEHGLIGLALVIIGLGLGLGSDLGLGFVY